MKLILRYIPLLFLLTIVLLSCQKQRQHTVDFYYWKTDVSFGDTEKEYFDKLASKKLYIRFFDVDNAGKGIFPQARIKSFDSKAIQAEFIPVVFVTNRALQGITYQGIDDLAKNISILIAEIAKQNNLPELKEIQIDCDWTESTRNDYFSLLKKLKQISKKQISCTIRLHQIAYSKTTGIPPVDKGYLMCYATSQPTEFTDQNSILDIGLLKSYTQNINDYPLPLDIALPLYSWAVVSNHLGKIKLINGTTKKDLAESTCMKPIDGEKYEITEDCFFGGLYLNKGFKVKVESVSPQLLLEAKKYLNDKIDKDYNIIYYHLDKPFLQQFTIEQLK